MALNVNTAINQANRLYDEISKLRGAKNKMISYRNSVSESWQGKEAVYILQAVEQQISQIDMAISELDSLSGDIKTAAEQIRKEELAAEAAMRARAQKQAKVRSAQKAYDEATEKLESLQEERENLVSKLQRASFRERFELLNDIKKIDEDIEAAEKKCVEKYNVLKAAKY